MKLEIQLEGMTFYAHHGVLEQERKVGNTFTVNLSLTISHKTSLYSDELADTIDYSKVYEVVKHEMSEPCLLLERLAGRLAKRLFEEFLHIEELTLSISKVKPPFSADISSATVCLMVQRGEL